jgi:transposase-like protein
MKKGFLLCAVAALAVACASSGPPASPALLAETEAAVRRAEAAGAGDRAPDLLAKARRAWDEGRLASGRGEGTLAIRRLEEAREYARAAEAQASAERTRSEAAILKQQADELEARTRQIRSAPTP